MTSPARNQTIFISADSEGPRDKMAALLRGQGHRVVMQAQPVTRCDFPARIAVTMIYVNFIHCVILSSLAAVH